MDFYNVSFFELQSMESHQLRRKSMMRGFIVGIAWLFASSAMSQSPSIHAETAATLDRKTGPESADDIDTATSPRQMGQAIPGGRADRAVGRYKGGKAPERDTNASVTIIAPEEYPKQ